MKYFIKKNFYNYSSPKIIGRTSCFGNRVSKLFNRFNYFNNQKFRIDNFIESFEKNESSLYINKKFNKLFIDKSLFAILLKQNNLNILDLNLRDPDFIFLESYSDLTDILFEHKAVGRFLCHLSDFTPSVWRQISTDVLTDKKLILNCGLLCIDKFYFLMEEFISNIKKRFNKDIPIIYLHTPTKFENRKKIIDRNKEIIKVTEKVSKNFNNFYSLKIPENKVSPLSDDCLTYHFSDSTVQYTYESIKEILKT